MNYNEPAQPPEPTESQVRQFRELMTRLHQCCQERSRYQSERFGLPEAELRCLLHFTEEKYLTPKGLARRLNVAKSRVTRLVEGLLDRKMIQRLKDPSDARVVLLTLTPAGRKKCRAIDDFVRLIHRETLTKLSPTQIGALLASLKLLESSLESVKDLMT
ncbi:MAG: MarR family winged helix-turn-helix transcriptional regulator [Thermodesulfobacteriota bacterium]